MECLNCVYETVCCISKPKFPVPYNFGFNGQTKTSQNEEAFETNFVKTSKYTWYDFLPKAVLLQFKRLANIYFLIIGILQSIPIISPLGPLTAWAPLIVVLAISVLREGYQDYQRYKSDKEMNYELKTHVRRNGRFEEVEWSKVLIGDVCRVQTEQLFPADMILLASSIEGGNAFIETASLDGQKNLKPRSAYPQTQYYNTEQKLSTLAGSWHGIVPDKELHKFSSNMRITSSSNTAGVQFYADKQLLYRGARLKNTKWIYGLVIYTGRNTKIMMNSDSSSEKMSQIERKVNLILGIILIIQITLCVIVAILYGFFKQNNMASLYYINWATYSTIVDSLLIWCTYFVLLNTMIPISLIVSIEIVKMSQSYFINKDNLMYSEYRKKGASVKSASLNEELGQIQYVFTDKTGTLTMNLMQFKIGVVGTHMFGDLGLISDHIPVQTEKGFSDENLMKLLRGQKSDYKNPSINVRNGNQSIRFENMKSLAQEYLKVLSIAHEVVAQTDKKGKLFYQGPSPDEISLVDAARQMNFQFIRSTQSTTIVKIRGVQTEFQLLQVFPFNSDRKRMSVVIRDGGLIKMYMKGADSIVKQRLSPQNHLNLDDELNRFSRIGLRTLLIGMRIISEDEYRTFAKNVEALPPTNKEQAFNKLVSSLQQGIFLIGATAVLDRLQDQVPETIRDLIRANIKVWMLTGDKMQTAENIAKSCNLIQNNFEILRYECKDVNQIATYLARLSRKAEELTANGIPKGFLIEGSDLTPIIGTKENEKQLANLAKYCEAVVCCRLLPIQKAEVVRIVRQQLNKVTLSIGDGANDVPMIKTAHIGVGLFGQEGMGAVQASDYALPEFRMLWRLLLVHGRWNYMRISEMILYFFYKNMLFTIPQFIFAFYNGFSGQTIFDDIYISLYNLIFTALPLVVRAILEQDVNYIVPNKSSQDAGGQDEHRERSISNLRPALLKSKQSKFIPKKYEMNKYLYKLFPKIYFIGQDNCIFNYSNYFMWVLEGTIEAVLITLFCIYILGTESLSSGGYSSDLWIVSITIYTTIIMMVTFKLSTHTKFWSGYLFFFIICTSVGLYIAYTWLSNWTFSTYVQGTAYMFWTTGDCYFIMLFCICLVLIIDGGVISIDFVRGGYASKMRVIIDEEREDNKSAFDALSLRATTENKSVNVETKPTKAGGGSSI